MHTFRSFYGIGVLAVSLFSFSASFADDYKAKKAIVAPIIDGKEEDACWSTVPWSPMNQVWVPDNATAMPASDYTGDYKAVWREDKLYILVRVTDDVLVNWHPNDPLLDYYKSDCPEIFIDENRSKGDHQCNYNAFAYHISTLFNVVDTDSNCQAQLFPDVLTGKARTQSGTTYYWEFEMNVFTDQYQLGAALNPKAVLTEGKIMGFSIAYNDSDVGMDRERMYGSQVISPPDPTYGTNVSYINADYLGTMELMAADLPTSFEEAGIENSLLIRPNPSKESFEVSGISYSNASLRLYNPQGQLVYEKEQVNKEETVITEHLQTGIYLLTIQSAEQTIQKKVLVK